MKERGAYQLSSLKKGGRLNTGVGSAVIGFSCCGVPVLIFCLHIYTCVCECVFFCILQGKANKINKIKIYLKSANNKIEAIIPPGY